MKGDILIQNIFNLFIFAIIIEASINAVFTMTALRDMAETRTAQAARDGLILLLSLFLCYKVEILNLFFGTGFKLPLILSVIISALVLTRMANLIRDFFARMKQG